MESDRDLSHSDNLKRKLGLEVCFWEILSISPSVGQPRSDGSQQWLSGPRLAAITRWDLGQVSELNLDAAEYVSAPYPPKPLTQAEIEARELSKPTISKSGKPTLLIETTTAGTGGRKEFFGHTAPRVSLHRDNRNGGACCWPRSEPRVAACALHIECSFSTLLAQTVSSVWVPLANARRKLC